MWAKSKLNSVVRMTMVVMAVVVLASCASAPEGDPEALAEYNKINDPIEPANRAFFAFNRLLDRLILKPITGIYRTITPSVIRESVHNFLNNLRTPVILANDLLQGEVTRAGDTVARFFINSTVGVLGFRDQATVWGFAHHDEDFGQTLAVWGAGEGPYLMVPLFGPSNPRDVVGKIVDFFIDPINWWANRSDNNWVVTTRTLVTAVDTRDQLWDVLDDLEKSSIDLYASIRSLYRQTRADAISNGEGVDSKKAPGLTGDFEITDGDEKPEKRGK
jgi:phospholipid-binding lipoprotein MlaA